MKNPSPAARSDCSELPNVTRQSWGFGYLPRLLTLGVLFFAVPSLASEPTPKTTPTVAPSKPYPRRLLFPNLKVMQSASPQRTELEEAAKLPFEKSRFSLVVLLATWNKRSQEILETLKEQMELLDRRSVSFYGIFPEETDLTFSEFTQKTKFPFVLGRVAPKSVAATRGIEIPSAWVVNNRGEVLGKWANLTSSETKSIVQKLILWTDF